jgi:hypothetical protein
MGIQRHGNHGVVADHAADAKPFITEFRSALRDLGYVEGCNVTITLRYAERAPERIGTLVPQLLSRAMSKRFPNRHLTVPSTLRRDVVSPKTQTA